MRLKEYTSLPKSADVSFKMTHLIILWFPDSLDFKQHIFPLLNLGFSGFKAGGGAHSVHPQSYGAQKSAVFIGLSNRIG